MMMEPILQEIGQRLITAFHPEAIYLFGSRARRDAGPDSDYDLLVEVKAWLHKAAAGLRAAELDLNATPPLIEDAWFHCRQAAEKARKAFLTHHDRIFRKTHDRDELARACEALEPGLTTVLEPARDLTVFAWEFRYPGYAPVPLLKEADAYRLLASRGYSAIPALLPRESRPVFQEKEAGANL
jgi:HEPN domain-containing protein